MLMLLLLGLSIASLLSRQMLYIAFVYLALNIAYTLTFDYPQFAQVLRNKVRDNSERIAQENGVEIEFIRKLNAFRKEARIEDIIKERGEQPGLVHIFSAMEACT